MRGIAFVAIVGTLSIAFGACGGGSEASPLDFYAADLQAVADAHETVPAQLFGLPYTLAGREWSQARQSVVDFSPQGRTYLDEIERIEPPPAVAALHEQYVRSGREVLAWLDKAAAIESDAAADRYVAGNWNAALLSLRRLSEACLGLERAASEAGDGLDLSCAETLAGS